MSECVQLVSWVEAEGDWKTEISIDAVGKLQQEFGDCENVLPVAVLGQDDCGGSSILDKLVGVGGTVRPFSRIRDFEGLVVYPKPIPIGKYQLLLMEMSGIDLHGNVEKLLMMRKVLLALISISAVPIICLENSTFFDYLNEILGIYGEMQENCHLTVSKFIVGIENDTFLVRNSAKFEGFLIGKFAGICDFFIREWTEISQDPFSWILANLQNESLHSLYDTTHQQAQVSLMDPDLQEPPSMISALLTIMRALLQLSNQDLAWERHIAVVPVFDRENCFSFIAEQEERQKDTDRLREATPMNFFMKMRDGTQAKLDEVTLAQIRRSYNMDEAIIVLTVLGGQGLGKSTFLNRVGQEVTGASKCRQYFKVGNTVTHTTLNSQVLSQPLRLPGSNIQLMLVDLEGLEGLEINNPKARIAQDNLISSILTVSSVICIIVKNETDSLNFVQEKLELIRDLMLTFRFVVERIYLLFHDKDLTSGTNPDFERNVEAWNRTYFSGQNTVIKIMNKPSFVVREKADFCKRFLNTLLSDVGFPKKNQNGKTINVLELISNLSYIVPYTQSDLRHIQLTEDEDRTAKEAIRKSTLQYERCFNQVCCLMNEDSLLTFFREQIKNTPKKQGISKNCATYIHIFLQLKKTEYLTRLAEIEHFYLAIQSVDISVLKAQVTAYLYFASQQRAVHDHFDRDVKQLKAKVQNVATRFPILSGKMKVLLSKITNLNRYLSVWYYVRRGLKLTKGLLPLIKHVLHFLSRRESVELAMDIAPVALDFVEKVIEPTEAQILEGRWQHSPDVARPLFAQDYVRPSLSLDLQFKRSLDDVRDVAVLLAVGKKRSHMSLFLNRFLGSIFPFAENSSELFKVNTNAQFCNFPLQVIGERRENERRGVIICIRMRRRTSHILSQVVAALLSNPCISCFFLDSTANDTTMIDNALENYNQRDRQTALVIVPPEANIQEAELRRKFRAKEIEINVKTMKVADCEVDWEKEFTRLREDFMNVPTISSQALIDALGGIGDQG